MGQLAIVNAPSSFTAIWSIMKPWLAKETVSKIDILGSDYQQVLLRLVDKENLPASLGGECTCEADGGCDHSFAGPWKEDKEERRARRKREAERSVNKHDEAKAADVAAAANGDHKEVPALVPSNLEVIPVTSVPQESADTVDPETKTVSSTNLEPIEKPPPVPGEIPGTILVPAT